MTQYDHKQDKEYDPNVLHYWFLDNMPDDDLIYSKGYNEQCMFFRDVIAPRLLGQYILRETPKVISTHTSKSVRLPVVEYSAFDGALKLIVRDNFHDFSVSVVSKYPIDGDFHGLLSKQTKNNQHFEGFQRDWIYPAYTPGSKKFSVIFREQYNFVSFVTILRSCFERKQANEKCEPFIVDTYLTFKKEPLFTNVYFLPSVHIGGRNIRYKLLKECTGEYLDLDFSDCHMMSNEWMMFINNDILKLEKKRISVCGMSNQLRGQAEELGCLDLLKKSVETSGK